MAAASIWAIGMITALPVGSASSADQVVRGAIASIKALPATKRNPAARRELLDAIDNALALDFLAKQALGPQWVKLSEVERRHFVAIYSPKAWRR